VFSSYVECLLHTFTNRDGWDNNDVLRPAISLVQLHDRINVAVCLASTSLHLYIEVWYSWCCLAINTFCRQRPVIRPLYSLYVSQYLGSRQGKLGVGETGVRTVVCLEQSRVRHWVYPTWINPIGNTVVFRLASEGLNNGIDSIGLVLLYFELELH